CVCSSLVDVYVVCGWVCVCVCVCDVVTCWHSSAGGPSVMLIRDDKNERNRERKKERYLTLHHTLPSPSPLSPSLLPPSLLPLSLSLPPSLSLSLLSLSIPLSLSLSPSPSLSKSFSP